VFCACNMYYERVQCIVCLLVVVMFLALNLGPRHVGPCGAALTCTDGLRSRTFDIWVGDTTSIGVHDTCCMDCDRDV